MFEKESLQELEERIRTLDPDCDSEEWLRLMEAYTARTAETLPDVDDSFQRFQQEYSGTEPIFAQAPETRETPKRRHVPVKLLRTALLAAALAALFSMTAYALGWFGLGKES